MTTTSPITDIHASEEKAKTHIAQAKTRNNKKIDETKEKEEEKLEKLSEKLRTEGKEKFTKVKQTAAQDADEELKKRKTNNESMTKGAQSNIPQAVERATEVFMEHIKG